MPPQDWPPPGTVTAPATPPAGRGLTVDKVGPLLPKDIG
jgi:hypothetical protein